MTHSCLTSGQTNASCVLWLFSVTMKTLLIMAALMTLVSGDVSLGYQYLTPKKSFDLATHQHTEDSSTFGLTSQGLPSVDSNGYNFRGPNSNQLGSHQSGDFKTAHHPNVAIMYNNVGLGYQSATNAGFQIDSRFQPGTNYHKQGSSVGYGSVSAGVGQTNYQQATGSASSGVGQTNYQQATGSTSSGVGQTTYQHATGSAQSASAVSATNQYKSFIEDYYKRVHQQPAQIFKHFYVHAAPEEPEVPKYRQPPVLPPPQKHYKIIFIKAPATPALTPQIIPIQQQNEEKTIVYVLVKKPEEQEEIILPEVEQKPPTKPEVFFIKYKGNDGQGVINNIVSDYNQNQASVSYSGIESEVSGGATVVGSAHSSSLSTSYGHPVGHMSTSSNQAVSLSSDEDTVVHAVSSGSATGQSHSTVSSVDSSAVVGGYETSVGSSAASIRGGGGFQDQHSYQTHGIEGFDSVREGVPHKQYGEPH